MGTEFIVILAVVIVFNLIALGLVVKTNRALENRVEGLELQLERLTGYHMDLNDNIDFLDNKLDRLEDAITSLNEDSEEIKAEVEDIGKHLEIHADTIVNQIDFIEDFEVKIKNMEGVLDVLIEPHVKKSKKKVA